MHWNSLGAGQHALRHLRRCANIHQQDIVLPLQRLGQLRGIHLLNIEHNNPVILVRPDIFSGASPVVKP